MSDLPIGRLHPEIIQGWSGAGKLLREITAADEADLQKRFARWFGRAFEALWDQGRGGTVRECVAHAYMISGLAVSDMQIEAVTRSIENSIDQSRSREGKPEIVTASEREMADEIDRVESSGGHVLSAKRGRT